MKTEKFEVLVVSLFYLLSRFQHGQSTVKAEHIVEHLQMLLAEPRVEQSNVLKASCVKLFAEWNDAAEHRQQSGLNIQHLVGTTLN